MASENYCCLFHNHATEYLMCIHSEPEPIPILKPAETAVFRQILYFIDGGVQECVAAHEKDVADGILKE